MKTLNDAKDILKKYYGYESFRPGQGELIEAVISGRDALGIMPTGAGKSLCFQIPALLSDGITIVISPLISLMKDQVASLNAAGIHAAYLNSSLTPGQYAKALEIAKTGRYKLIYVAPERLDTPRFLDFALDARVNISFLAVDEAHCVSQWGQDFRPSYLKIMDFVKRLPKRPVIGAYTATATRQVREDVKKILELNDPKCITTGFDRDNLYFAVEKPKDKDSALSFYIREKEDAMPGLSGIVYCGTRKNVEKVADRLIKDGFSAAAYHAGMSEEDRSRNQEAFINGEVQIMVATNAFGMGIDKPDVRFVVHYNMPKDMESYYQEAGRAGRDGEMAECMMFYSGRDVKMNEFFIEHDNENDEMTEEEREVIRERDRERLKKMTFYCFSKTCLRDYILRYFGETGMAKCDNCSVCLGRGTGEAVKYASKERTRTRSRDISFNIPEGIGDIEYDSERSAMYSAQASEGLSRRQRRQSMLDSMSSSDREIFEALREVRTRLAKEHRTHPYIIFADKTLILMSKARPHTKEEMLEISGVGEFKYEKYGEEFLDALNSFR
ncbi:ATP-dependent DNA helicase RecQ [Lachnospiraceae bacterium]|nr:ATP-dependent DNA helicase RecQ [Lachnospiraceae bacterium]